MEISSCPLALPPAVHQLAVERVLLNYIEIHLNDTQYPDIASLDPPQAKVVAFSKNSAEPSRYERLRRRYGPCPRRGGRRLMRECVV